MRVGRNIDPHVCNWLSVSGLSATRLRLVTLGNQQIYTVCLHLPLFAVLRYSIHSLNVLYII